MAFNWQQRLFCTFTTILTGIGLFIWSALIKGIHFTEAFLTAMFSMATIFVVVFLIVKRGRYFSDKI